jgi:hypothetical protein
MIHFRSDNPVPKNMSYFVRHLVRFLCVAGATTGLAVRCGAQTPTFTQFPVSPQGVLNGIAPGPDGNLWFTDISNNQVGKITPGGAVTEWPLSNRAIEITTGPDGNLWFTEDLGNMIGRITLDGTVTEFPIPTTLGCFNSGRRESPLGPTEIFGSRPLPAGSAASLRPARLPRLSQEDIRLG